MFTFPAIGTNWAIETDEPLPQDIRSLVLHRIDQFDRLFTATDGATDPLVGRHLELLGYDAQYSLRPTPAAERWRGNWAEDVHRDGTTVHTQRPLVIDVGAVGKSIDDANAPTWLLVTFMIPVGAGGSLTVPALTALLLDRVPAEHAGTASGVLNTARQLGGALAIAVFGALVATTAATFLARSPEEAATT